MVLIKNAFSVPGMNGWLLIDFDNGSKKLVDIKPHMRGVLDQLRDPDFFKQVFVDKELGTVTWPGELDFDPDCLYQEGIDIEEIKNLIKIAQNSSFIDMLERA